MLFLDASNGPCLPAKHNTNWCPCFPGLMYLNFLAGVVLRPPRSWQLGGEPGERSLEEKVSSPGVSSMCAEDAGLVLCQERKHCWSAFCLVAAVQLLSCVQPLATP